MMLAQKRRKSLIFGLLGIVVLFNLLISVSQLDIFATSSDRLLFYLAAESEQRPVFLLTFALQDLYEANQITVDPKVADLLGITPETPERVGGIEEIIIESVVAPVIDGDVTIYDTRDEIQMLFLDMESSKLSVSMVDDLIIVMENNK